jgi:hypothetical protein
MHVLPDLTLSILWFEGLFVVCQMRNRHALSIAKSGGTVKMRPTRYYAIFAA